MSVFVLGIDFCQIMSHDRVLNEIIVIVTQMSIWAKLAKGFISKSIKIFTATFFYSLQEKMIIEGERMSFDNKFTGKNHSDDSRDSKEYLSGTPGYN